MRKFYIFNAEAKREKKILPVYFLWIYSNKFCFQLFYASMISLSLSLLAHSRLSMLVCEWNTWVETVMKKKQSTQQGKGKGKVKKKSSINFLMNWFNFYKWNVQFPQSIRTFMRCRCRFGHTCQTLCVWVLAATSQIARYPHFPKKDMIEYYYLKFLGLNASKVFAKCYKFMYNIRKPINYLL